MGCKTQTFTNHCLSNIKMEMKTFLESPITTDSHMEENSLNWCSLLDVIWYRNEPNKQLKTHNVHNIQHSQ